MSEIDFLEELSDEELHELVLKYYDFLLDLVCFEEDKIEYSLMLSALFNTDFTWVNPMDEDRAMDGLHLRKVILSECLGIDVDIIGRKCSFLEMLVAFCDRISFKMYLAVEDDSLRRWFWEIIEISGLGKYADEVMHFSEDINQICTFVTKMCHYGTRENPDFSLFGRKKHDLRKKVPSLMLHFYSYCDKNYPL